MKANKVGFNKSIEIYQEFLEKKWIDIECTVLNPLEIANWLYDVKNHYTDVQKVLNKNEFIQKAQSAKIIIGLYKTTTHGHFVLLDKNLNVIFDPLGNSETVKNGALAELRVYY